MVQAIEDADTHAQTDKKVTPIVDTKIIVEKSKHKVEIRFCINPQLEQRIKDFAKPLQERAVMPTFIVSHFKSQKELGGMILYVFIFYYHSPEGFTLFSHYYGCSCELRFACSLCRSVF